MRIFILEDNPYRMVKFRQELIGHEIHHAETVDEGVALLSVNKYDVLLLDHDLGGDEMVDSHAVNTGYQLAKFVASLEQNTPTLCIIHSCNPAVADNIQKVLPHAVKIPFPSLKIESIPEWVNDANS